MHQNASIALLQLRLPHLQAYCLYTKLHTCEATPERLNARIIIARGKLCVGLERNLSMDITKREFEEEGGSSKASNGGVVLLVSHAFSFSFFFSFLSWCLSCFASFLAAASAMSCSKAMKSPSSSGSRSAWETCQYVWEHYRLNRKNRANIPLRTSLQ